VLNVANRHPGLLANMAAAIQQVSGGRLLLGLGAGGHRRLPPPTDDEIATVLERVHAGVQRA
jgi:alkanesulfonate monooxygenase SsuD/methylene tetrahydromethanopterin reductase-like flavin-dependent oxidoreductase (luciferase family)